MDALPIFFIQHSDEIVLTETKNLMNSLVGNFLEVK